MGWILSKMYLSLPLLEWKNMASGDKNTKLPNCQFKATKCLEQVLTFSIFVFDENRRLVLIGC